MREPRAPVPAGGQISSVGGSAPAVGRAIDAGALAAALDDPGWLVVPGLVPDELCERLRLDVDVAVEEETRYHGGTDHHWHGRVLFCPRYGGGFMEILDQDAWFAPVEGLLGEDAILYTMTTSCLDPGETNTSSELHVDMRRTIPGYPLGISMFVVVDDLTEEHGSTMLLPRSQHRSEPPGEDEFRRGAERLVAPAGSVVYAHPGVWHRSGRNVAGTRRRVVLMLMVRSWMKQRFDAARIVEPGLRPESETARRRLGLLSVTPSSYDEFYENARTGAYRRS